MNNREKLKGRTEWCKAAIAWDDKGSIEGNEHSCDIDKEVRDVRVGQGRTREAVEMGGGNR